MTSPTPQQPRQAAVNRSDASSVSGTALAADAAFEACAWAVAATAYAAADEEHSLQAAALERWGLAAFLAGRDGESDRARERAHHAFLACGDVEAAARVGHWLGVTLAVRREWARSGGWFTRVQTLLDEHALGDSVWRGRRGAGAGPGGAGPR
jgi:hypothetical protein